MNDDCSDILVVNDSMAIAAHNEDANVALVGHTYVQYIPIGNSLYIYIYVCIYLKEFTSKKKSHCSYLIKGKLKNGLCFTAYTYAGELPSCAFGFNNHGLVLLYSDMLQIF